MKKPKEEKGELNKVSEGGDLAESVRKAEVLDYINGAGDVAKEAAEFRRENPDFVEHSRPSDVYPKG